VSERPLSVVGVSHRTASLTDREPFAFSDDDERSVLTGGGSESLLLVTCNRTELYGLDDPTRMESRLSAAAGVDGSGLFRLTGSDAVQHLFAVAAGLESMVVGEPQILGQVKRAMGRAREAGALGPVLDELARRALTVGRRVRAETAVGKGLPSVPKVATAVARLVLGELSGRTVLVVGTGAMGAETARLLRSAGAQLVVAGRTAERVEELAGVVDGRAEGLGRLDELLATVDLTLTCTGTPEPLLTRDRVARAAARRNGAALNLVDIAVPRDVAPEARQVSHVRLYDLDDLRGWSSEVVPPEAVRRAEEIVAREAASFLAWRAARAAVPTIRELHARVEEILDAELAGASPEEAAALRPFGRRLLRTLLHEPVTRLKRRTAEDGEDVVALARELFALESRGRNGTAPQEGPREGGG